MITAITLNTPDRPSTVLQMTEVFHPYKVEDILAVSKTVYADVYYDFNIESDTEIKYANVFLNDEKIGYYCSNVLTIENDFLNKNPLFHGQLGFVHFSVEEFGNEADPKWYYSEYASILIRSNQKGKALEDMLKYIYSNQYEVLLYQQKKTKVQGQDDEVFTDFWSRLSLVEDIAKTYEFCYGYFKSNSRFKLKEEDIVDRVEKLQNIDSRTISYIVSHPDSLVQSYTGFKYGGRRYLPTKTLMQKKQVSQDIYENQVVRSFLHYVFSEVQKLSDEIDMYLDLLTKPVAENGYIVSSTIFYESAKETLIEYKERVGVAVEKLNELQGLYQEALNVRLIDCQVQPRPTTILMTIPQYNRIYMCMTRWYGSSGFDFTRERVMLSFISAPSVYEYYVLVKLVNQIREIGFQLKEKDHKNYPMPAGSQHVVKDFYNTFVYENEEAKLTLYYEPVLSVEDSREVTGISLYRNNSVSVKNDVSNTTGDYYVPDYLIKIEIKDSVRYLVCDAKYSNVNTVRKQLIPDLTYKYLISLSAIGNNDSLEGMAVFYGLPDNDASEATFYDKKIGNISPFIEMCPLTENISNRIQENIIRTLIQNTAKY